MSIYNLSILFWLRKSRAKNTQERTIICRITVNGSQSEFSTGEQIDPERWDEHAKEVKGTKDDAKTLNHRLEIIKSKIRKIFSKLEENEEIITADLIKLHLEGKIDDHRNRTLKQAFNEAISEMEALSKTGHQKDVTTTRYRITFKNVKAFIKEKYGKEDIYLKDLLTRGKIEFAFAKDYEHWGKTSIGPVENKPKQIWKESYCKKEIVRINTILNIAITKGWLERNPFDNVFKSAKASGEKKYLTEEQLNILKQIKPVKDILQETLDIFIFQCYTGLAFAEVHGLSANKLKFGIKGYNWIFTTRIKTLDSSGKECQIIMPDEAKEILDKYKDHPLCVATGQLLPVKTNQEYNRSLKIILEIANDKGAGIKNLTTHTPRHTATTLLLEKGLSPTFIAEMLGHTSIKLIGTTYGAMTPTKLAREMDFIKYMEQEENKNKQIVNNI